MTRRMQVCIVAQAGQRDLFTSGLPGTPDNISFNGRDTFWVAMPMLRSAADALAGYPLVRKLLSHLPVESLGAGVTPCSLYLGSVIMSAVALYPL